MSPSPIPVIASEDHMRLEFLSESPLAGNRTGIICSHRKTAYYARTKGRTQEIPPDGSRSPLPPRPSFGHQVSSRSLPDLSADVRAALEAPKHDDVAYRHSVWTRCRCCRPGRGPLALLRRFALVPLIDALQFLEEASESVPPVMPALVASIFLLIALPLLIAWDYL
ncbi:uncharacterized protein GLRG_03527 [Colletotrichum graminicola M1.001]|uniref:Uncharacterized protein n=1 Tax=Colletotrichum graminicola (strain M1.001 / M2 / FGSC 10212) TaxID=645133 RepID=E3QBP4_COLGM|nr:uncharacterized protein GLRG_03527 [Colletotrichum graminicola M1.001]EFQ28383.1 hypothetical protein GLRG_03527 [Colletotrichum graminicola M1.001]